MMFSEAISGRDFENQAWWRSTCSLMNATSSFMPSLSEARMRRDKYVRPKALPGPSAPELEAADFSLDDPVRQLVDVLEFLVDQDFGVFHNRAKMGPFLWDNLSRRGLGLVDWLPDLGDDADPDLFHLARVLLHDAIRDLERQEVVQLPDVRHRIFPGGGLHRHRSVRGDEAAHSVPAADAPIVPVLPGEPRDREVEDPRIVVVACVDVDLHGPVRVLHGVVEEPLRVIQAAEVHGALADLAVERDVRFDVQVRAIRREVLVGRLDRRRPIGQPFPVHHRRRAPHQEDVRRLEEHAAAELRRALSADDLDLIRVVVEDPSESVHVHLAEGPRHDLREAVRYAVRMADPLAFDDFRPLLLDRRVDEFLHVDVPCHESPPTVVPRGCLGAYMAFVATPNRGQPRGRRTAHPDSVSGLVNNIPLNQKFRQEYVPPARSASDDAGPGGDPTFAEGPRPYADVARPPLEREPVDDREDREEADESVVRCRATRLRFPPDRIETAGEASPCGPDPDAKGPVPRSETAARECGGRDAALEVLANARHAQRPSGRFDLGKGDQRSDLIGQRPERPRPDPCGRGHGARVPAGRRENPRRARGEPAPTLQCGPRDVERRGHGNPDEIGPDEAPVVLSLRATGWAST